MDLEQLHRRSRATRWGIRVMVLLAVIGAACGGMVGWLTASPGERQSWDYYPRFKIGIFALDALPANARVPILAEPRRKLVLYLSAISRFAETHPKFWPTVVSGWDRIKTGTLAGLVAGPALIILILNWSLVARVFNLFKLDHGGLVK